MRSKEVCKRANITYRQLDYWCRAGYLGESRATDFSQGKGNEREFTRPEVELLEVVGRLLRVGFEVKSAMKIAKLIEQRIYLGDGITLLIEPHDARKPDRCQPELYLHIGPWQRVGYDDVERCMHCGNTSGEVIGE